MSNRKPWYFTSQQWNDKVAQDARWASQAPSAGPAAPSYQGATGFEGRLAGIIDRADNEGEQQSGLLLLLVREIHTIKLILWWVLIIVPIVVVVFGALLLGAAHQAPATTSTFGY
jgi:hypothetical protein